jgi:hypothetical protein
VLPRSGDVLHVTRAASVQFAEPLVFRVIRVHEWPTYDGWIWLDGYELDAAGDAVERRSIFVQLAGLRRLRSPDDVRNATRRQSVPPSPAPRADPPRSDALRRSARTG